MKIHAAIAFDNAGQFRYNLVCLDERIRIQLVGNDDMKNQAITKTEKKRKKEQFVVAEMIALYCRKKHTPDVKGGLCPDCRELCEYAQARSEHCPFMEEKTFCSNCRVHCYKPDMRERIRDVMRFSGPRMLLYHPGMALWHLISSKREKRRMKRTKTAES